MIPTHEKLIYKGEIYQLIGWYSNEEYWTNHAKEHNFYPTLSGWLRWAQDQITNKVAKASSAALIYPIDNYMITEIVPIFDLKVKEVKHWRITHYA